MKKRIFASLLSLCLIVGLLPMSVLAAENEAPDNEKTAVYAELEGCVENTYDANFSLYETPNEPEMDIEESKSLPALENVPTADNLTEPLGDISDMSGTCGAAGNENNVTWTLTQNNTGDEPVTYTLTISGSGAMTDYGAANDVPWYSAYNDKITIGIVEDGITHLGARTFVLLAKLESVTLPNSLISIGESAFNQSGLTSIALPSNLKTIGKNAFWHGNLTGTLEIPESVETINDGAFDQNKLTSVILPNQLKTLGSSVFKGNPLTSMPEIPLGITALIATFQGCTSLTEIEIPSHITTLDRTFMGCTGLTNVTIPETVESYVGAFNGCTGLTNAVIKSKATDIGGANTNRAYGVFGGCTSLKAVSVPEHVTVIGIAAFKDCSALETTEFINRVTNIGLEAFSGCSNLKGSLNLSANEIGARAFDKCSGLGPDISIANATSVGEAAFRDCSQLTGIVYAQKVSGGANLVSKRSVTALLNGGTFSEETRFESEKLATPIKKDAIFDGWYENSDFSGQAVTEPKKNNTYYAKWIELNTNKISLEYGSSSDNLPTIEGVTLSNWQSGDTSIVSVEDNKLKANKVGTTTLTATATTEAGGSAVLTVDVEVTPMPITFGNGKGENPSGTVDHVYDGMAPDYFDYAAFYPATVEDGKVSIVPGSQEVALEAGNDLVFVYDDGSGSGAQDHDSLPVNVTDSEGMNVTVKLLNPNYRFVTDTNTTLSETVSVTVKIHADNMDKQDLYINGEKVDVITDAFVKTYNGQGQAPVSDLTTVRSEGIDTFTVHFHPLNSNTDFEETHLTGTASNLTAEAVLKKAPKEPGQYLMIVNGLKEGTGTERGRYAYASAVFSIEKATVTIRPNDKTICVGDALPELGADDYTVTGLAPGDSLTALPTLAYDGTPDTTKEGNYAIKASGAAVDEEHYTLKYEDGVLTISLSSGNTDPDDPGNSGNTGDSGNTDKTDKTDKTDSLTKSPHTGDMGNITVWTALFALSIIAAAAAFLRKKIR